MNLWSVLVVAECEAQLQVVEEIHVVENQGVSERLESRQENDPSLSIFAELFDSLDSLLVNIYALKHVLANLGDAVESELIRSSLECAPESLEFLLYESAVVPSHLFLYTCSESGISLIAKHNEVFETLLIQDSRLVNLRGFLDKVLLTVQGEANVFEALEIP